MLRCGDDQATLQRLHYTHDRVGNVTDIRDSAQQTVYFANAVVEVREFAGELLRRLQGVLVVARDKPATEVRSYSSCWTIYCGMV